MDTDDLKEEIKRRADLAAIVGQYVPLQRSGRRLKARCPFHAEKTPSFYVNPEEGFWHCFGCGAGGDVFSFLMKIENLTFPEAAERVARQVGLEWRGAPADAAKTERRKLQQRALDLAAEYFQSRLQAGAGADAREYLAGRGLSEETLREFRLGYAPPGWENLGRYLSSKGLGLDLLREVDLVRAREHSGGFYDTFRNRIMFPIVDAAGHVTGFGGRALDPEDPAKYLNSAETPLFHKGRQVYGLPQARQAMGQAGYVVLVEGYTDVIALHQAGFRQAVAALGTALTEDHVRLLGRYVETVVLCYDADTAGQNAALRNLEVFERVGVEAQVVALPGGVDPDEFIRGRGLEEWEKLIQNRLSLAEYQLEMVFSRYRDQGEQGLTKAAARAINVLTKVRDRVRRDELVARAADRWGQGNPGRVAAMQRTLAMEVARRMPQRFPARQDRAAGTELIERTLAAQGEELSPGRRSVERQLLCLALQDADWCRRLTEMLREDDFSPGPHRNLAAALFAHLRESATFAPHEVVEGLAEGEGCRALGVELLLAAPPEPVQEVILPLVENLRRLRGVVGIQAKYEVPPGEDEPPADEVAATESFAELRARVIAALSRGEISQEDPDYQRYCRLAQKIHGRGGYQFLQPSGPLGGGETPPGDR
jgi:DNA primase